MKINDITGRTLQEDAEADQGKYERAREVIQQIVRHTWDHESAEDNYGFMEVEMEISKAEKYGGVFFCITPQMIGSKGFPQDLMIAVGVSGNSGANGTLMKNPALAQHFPGVHYMIALYCLRSPDAARARTMISGNMRVLSTLLHELVHYFDEKDHALIGKKTGYDDREEYPNHDAKNKAYFNDGMENNAYFHVIAERLASLIKDFREHPNDAQDYAELFDFSPDFTKTLQGALLDARVNSDAIRGFLKHMKAPRYRRMVARLYKLHQLAMETLKQANAQKAQMKQAA